MTQDLKREERAGGTKSHSADSSRRDNIAFSRIAFIRRPQDEGQTGVAPVVCQVHRRRRHRHRPLQRPLPLPPCLRQLHRSFVKLVQRPSGWCRHAIRTRVECAQSAGVWCLHLCGHLMSCGLVPGQQPKFVTDLQLIHTFCVACAVRVLGVSKLYANAGWYVHLNNV